MTDLFPFYYTASAVVLQCAFGLALGLLGVGDALGCIWFLACEHIQSEYLWIAKLGNGKLDNMPWVWVLSSGLGYY